MFDIHDETTITITGLEDGLVNNYDDSDQAFGGDGTWPFDNGYGKLSIGHVVGRDWFSTFEKEESLNLVLDNVALKNLGLISRHELGKRQAITYIEGTNVSQAEQNNLTINIHANGSEVLKGLKYGAIYLNDDASYDDADPSSDRYGKVHIYDLNNITVTNTLTHAQTENLSAFEKDDVAAGGFAVNATKKGIGTSDAVNDDNANILLDAVNDISLSTVEDEAIIAANSNGVKLHSDFGTISITTAKINADNNVEESYTAISSNTGAKVNIEGAEAINVIGSVKANADESFASDETYSNANTSIDLKSSFNFIQSNNGESAIVAKDNSHVTLTSTGENSSTRTITSGNIVQALNGTAIDGSNNAQVSLSSQSANYVLSKDNAINIASGADATVTAADTNKISAEQIGVHVDGTDGSESSFNLSASTNIITAGASQSDTIISTMNNQPVIGIDMTGGKGDIASNVTHVRATSGATSQSSGVIDLDNLNLNTVGIKLVNDANLTVSKSEQSGISTFAARSNPLSSAVVSDNVGVYVEDSYYESKQTAHFIQAGATDTFAESTTQAFADWNRILQSSDAYNNLIYQTNSELLENLNAVSNGLVFGDNIAVNSVYTNSEINTENSLRGVSYEADSGNAISGAVIADSRQEDVDFNDVNQDVISISTDFGNNYILSSAIIKDATAQQSTDNSEIDKTQVHTAVYALGEESEIKIENSSSDGWNFIMTNSPKENEHVVRASNGGDVIISGNTFVSANANYNEDGFIDNNVGLALVAGTADGQDESQNEIKVNADDGNNYHTYIFGDVTAGHSGSIQISNKDSEGATFIRGNVLAANGGSVDLNLGTNGIWIGRGDDYGDASADSEHGNNFYNPAFSNEITNSGTVNVTMGANSKWYLTGQSWISSLTTTGAADIYMSNNVASTEAADGIYDKTHALLIGTLSGGNNDATFHMSLNHNDHSVSDMLYIREVADGVGYKVNILGSIDGFENISDENQLRFATIKGNNSVFAGQHVKYDDMGMYNWDLKVNVVEHVNNQEDDDYNGEALSTTKPGNDNLENFFNSDSQSEISTFALAAKQDDSETLYDYYLTKVTNGPVLSDAAQSVINLSRANYATAVYMDTLNKRQGEARFANGSDNGVWVRLRYDNIGKDDAFRTHDTMVELGFDQGIALESGSLHTGVALDYMNGQIDYHTVNGDGDIERYGLWFYTTYLGNDGQYADLVLKYGHLKNDFGFNTRSQGEHVSGDYSNDVASISAEYGWKFSNSHNYYIEPQAQLQYSYVTGADYTTSQGTEIELDSIHSLIGRIGFRAGKDFNTETPINAYIRGDVLHEFLGDQDIYASDPTGVMDVTYENDDTWYSAGVGLSVQSSENTYFFIEGEQVFGADNDNTYTVSGGFKHSF